LFVSLMGASKIIFQKWHVQEDNFPQHILLLQRMRNTVKLVCLHKREDRKEMRRDTAK
jgi:hypothetical protein